MIPGIRKSEKGASLTISKGRPMPEPSGCNINNIPAGIAQKATKHWMIPNVMAIFFMISNDHFKVNKDIEAFYDIYQVLYYLK